MKSLEIQIRTLTPLWTGGVDRNCDRLHETGLIGSLRWWYEALVRGLGGYACDPTEDGRCEYDPRRKLPPEKQMCPACYLFGCTGWARRFRLRVVDESLDRVPLHFYTTLPVNRRWLGSIFGDERRNNHVNGITVLYGKFRIEIVGRGRDDEYGLKQLAWVLEFAAQYGGLAAKLQHGFGQVVLDTDLSGKTANAEEELKQRLAEFYQLPNKELWPSRANFFCRKFRILAKHRLFQFIVDRKNLIGVDPRNNRHYIPCVFDLRYKGGQIDGRQLGFRQWLLNKKWPKTQINALLGETGAQYDEERSASRLCMGMPWLDDQDGKYVIKVFGFVPPSLTVDQMLAEIRDYLRYLVECNS